MPSSSASANSVVIVDAVRTPIGKRNGGLASIHPAELLGVVQPSSSSAPASTRPRSARSSAVASARSASRASTSPARRGWRPGCPLSTPATTVDTQCGSSQQATNLATSLVGSGVVDVALACGVEVMSRIPIGVELVEEARPRRADPEDVLRPLRDDVAVRGRRAHRRQVGHHPRGHRRVRAVVARAGRRGVGRGPLRRPVGAGRRRRTSTRTASPPGRRTSSSATRASASRRSRSWRRSSRSPARTACTPPATRRRSPTAPRPC